MGMPINFNSPIPQVIQSVPVVPQSEPRKNEVTYKLDSLDLHETRMPNPTYSLDSVYMMQAIGQHLNTTA